jgi:hypothetical protein
MCRVQVRAVFDDLAAYFHENIVASYIAYREVRDNETYGRSRDMRAALVAATALYHLREHVPKSQRKTRRAIVSECPDYDVLGDVVNAAKHRELERGKPKLKSAEDIYELTVIIQYEDPDGTYQDAQKMVVVKFLDGTEQDILECLTNVMNYWGHEFVRLGFQESYKPFEVPPSPGDVYVSRDDARRLNTEIIRGVRFKQTMKLLKYDSATGKSEPIDLTGSKLQYRISKPSYVVDLHITHRTTGKEYTFELKLDEDQSLEWHSLRTDAEREAFSERLSQERQEEIKGLLAAKLAEDSKESPDSENAADT